MHWMSEDRYHIKLWLFLKDNFLQENTVICGKFETLYWVGFVPIPLPCLHCSSFLFMASFLTISANRGTGAMVTSQLQLVNQALQEMCQFLEQALCYLPLESFVSLCQLKHLVGRVESKWKWLPITTSPVFTTVLNCDFTLPLFA